MGSLNIGTWREEREKKRRSLLDERIQEMIYDIVSLTFTILCKELQRKILPNFSWIESQKHQAGAGPIVHRVRWGGLLWGQHWLQLALVYPRRLHWGHFVLNFVGIPPRISSKITSAEIQRCGELRESKWRNCIPTFVSASEHLPQSRHLRGRYVEIIIILRVSESKWEIYRM